MYSHAIWLYNSIVLDNAKEAIHEAVVSLLEVEFDTIAFCGMSGALFGPVLAHRMDKKMILVRKADDKRHSSYDEEGYKNAERVLIVDDVCSSGATVKHIIEGVKKHCGKQVKFVGAYFYGEGRGACDSPRGFVTCINMSGVNAFSIDFLDLEE